MEMETIAQEEGGASPIKADMEIKGSIRTPRGILEVNAKNKTTSMSYSSIQNKRRKKYSQTWKFTVPELNENKKV